MIHVRGFFVVGDRYGSDGKGEGSTALLLPSLLHVLLLLLRKVL
jgi:hypothetical protein